MGNESSRLKGLIIDRTAVEANDFWALHNAEMPTTTTTAAATTNEEGRQYLSIFQEEAVVNGQLWVAQGPLERAIKNLMIYRHPYILKYVTTWEKGGQKYLATERVRPLTTVLAQQTDLQLCLGLRTILCSLIFLTEKAMARHLNICTQSIYITDNGSWRLAGFEYVWKSKDVTKTILERSKTFRYKNAIDPDEAKDENMSTIEQYAFGTLCEEVLEKCASKTIGTHTATPHSQEFREYCTTHLKHKNAQMRPKLSAILLHPYFNHEFVLIHSFLFELPLKSLYEKQDFFTGLIDRLRHFDEEVVGAQLARDLLSRMVLLDPTAQLCVTPCVLRTKGDHKSALFSAHTYKSHLLPHILKMFRLRDAQIRLILLEYFMEYVRLLSEQELEDQILPHLLAGMNDTNDVLVAKTLRCMADLIPILGATAVVGGQRLRLFSDGRPQAAVPDSSAHWVEPRSITPVMNSSDSIDYMVSGSPIPGQQRDDLSSNSNSNSSSSLPGMASIDLDLPTRLSPDGGEDVNIATILTDKLQNGIATTSSTSTSHPTTPLSEKSALKSTIGTPTSNVQQSVQQNVAHADDDEAWSDWDEDDHHNDTNRTIIEQSSNKEDENDNMLPLPPVDAESTSSFATLPSQVSLSDSYRTAPSNASSAQSLKPSMPSANIDDLNAFDIQVQLVPAAQNEQKSEFDFFKDMEPVIKSTPPIVIPPLDLMQQQQEKVTAAADVVCIDSNRFAAIPADSTNALLDVALDEGDGWNVSDTEEADNDEDKDDDAMLC